ncbi:hypothetical protein E5909_10100 [Salmonella enterica subsp. enterica serovar Anatum]|nr:hypothetical protein [Salmonella enterica]ECB8699551.1 hypothetical protein [Salmonella enterica subsp. enterica serovar Anatum]ECN5456627.1 hypothetical protein [Salmonella enterica subsp. enterica serovar Typhimurium]ECB9042911.1 hypothetical protein [Salmonella enterica subsp. enterica serovar Anatum]ECJ0418161.1 hypothetical protein [Salmonella enterica subsp. enterica serovar Anatum]
MKPLLLFDNSIKGASVVVESPFSPLSYSGYDTLLDVELTNPARNDSTKRHIVPKTADVILFVGFDLKTPFQITIIIIKTTTIMPSDTKKMAFPLYININNLMGFNILKV